MLHPCRRLTLQLCLKTCCIETSGVLGASMHQICGVDIFLPKWCNKIVRFKKYTFLLRVALAGRFWMQCAECTGSTLHINPSSSIPPVSGPLRSGGYRLNGSNGEQCWMFPCGPISASTGSVSGADCLGSESQQSLTPILSVSVPRDAIFFEDIFVWGRWMSAALHHKCFQDVTYFF